MQRHDYLHRYDTTDVTLAIQDRSVHMTKIADLDVLLEEVDPVYLLLACFDCVRGKVCRL